MSIQVTIDGLDYDVDVTMIDSPSGIDPETYMALRGLKGDKGDTGSAGVDGSDGSDGADGVGITSITQNLDGTLTITLDDGTSYDTDPVKGDKGDKGDQGDPIDVQIDGTSIVDEDVANIPIATSSVDGIMSSTDKAKLDTIEEGAEISKFREVTIGTSTNANQQGSTTDVILKYRDSNNADKTIRVANVKLASSNGRGLMSKNDKIKLDGIATGAEVNVQSDWGQTTTTADDYIKNKPSIPSKTSDLTNDSGFITGYTETDPVFTASPARGITDSDITNWNGKSDFSGDYDDLTNKPTIPTVSVNLKTTSGTNIADIVIDGVTTQLYAPSSGGGLVTDVTVDGTSVVSGGVASIDLTGKADASDIPTKVSDLTNDAGYITGYTETDPIFLASAAHGISASDISNWNGKSDFSGDYNDLTNKPTIPTVPTNVSAFTNDAGYLTSYTETDPTVPAWAKASTKPTYTASEVGALPDTTSIPSKTSDLTNDSGFLSAETDPVFTASDAYGIASTDIANWDNAYGGRISLDTTAQSGDDYNLTQILTSFGWLNDVIV